MIKSPTAIKLSKPLLAKMMRNLSYGNKVTNKTFDGGVNVFNHSKHKTNIKVDGDTVAEEVGAKLLQP